MLLQHPLEKHLCSSNANQTSLETACPNECARRLSNATAEEVETLAYLSKAQSSCLLERCCYACLWHVLLRRVLVCKSQACLTLECSTSSIPCCMQGSCQAGCCLQLRLMLAFSMVLSWKPAVCTL